MALVEGLIIESLKVNSVCCKIKEFLFLRADGHLVDLNLFLLQGYYILTSVEFSHLLKHSCSICLLKESSPVQIPPGSHQSLAVILLSKVVKREWSMVTTVYRTIES